MGTWALQRDKIPAFIRELEDFKKRVYHVAGDDSLFDHIYRAIDRLDELAATEARPKKTGLGYAEIVMPDYYQEFDGIFRPAGFLVYTVDKVEDKEMYILKVGRSAPTRRSEGISNQNGHPACPDDSHCQADSPLR